MPRGSARSPKAEARKALFTGVQDQRVPCAGCDELHKRSSLASLTDDKTNVFCFRCRSLMAVLLEPLGTRGDLDAYYQRTYQMTFKGYSTLFFQQGGRCAICKQIPRERHLFVDHCHKTTVVRGLLCSQCNSGLGMFRDSVTNLARAIVYLEK